MLDRSTIKAVADIKTKEVEVPEWGDSVLVRSLTGKERDGVETYMMRNKGTDVAFNTANLRARLVISTCVDKEGNLIFDEKDLGWLGDKNAKALDRVASVAMELSGMKKADVKDMTGNSDATQEEDSISA